MTPRLHLLAAAALLTAGAQAQTLSGWALMPAATFADGPTSGQFAGAQPLRHQPAAVHRPAAGAGLLGRAAGPRADSFHFLVDNGFGGQSNSADALLRSLRACKSTGARSSAAAGTVRRPTGQTGRPRAAFDARTRVQLNDANRLLRLPIQADYTHYYNNPANPPVDPRPSAPAGCSRAPISTSNRSAATAPATSGSATSSAPT